MLTEYWQNIKGGFFSNFEINRNLLGIRGQFFEKTVNWNRLRWLRYTLLMPACDHNTLFSEACSSWKVGRGGPSTSKHMILKPQIVVWFLRVHLDCQVWIIEVSRPVPGSPGRSSRLTQSVALLRSKFFQLGAVVLFIAFCYMVHYFPISFLLCSC